MPAGAAVSPDSYIPFYLDSQDHMALPQQTPTLSIPTSQVEPIAWDNANSADMSAVSQTSDGWSLDMLPMANIPPPVTTCPSYASVPSPGEMSGPSTPGNFLPIQQFDRVFPLLRWMGLRLPRRRVAGADSPYPPPTISSYTPLRRLPRLACKWRVV